MPGKRPGGATILARVLSLLPALGLAVMSGCRGPLPFASPPPSPQYVLVVEPADLLPGEIALGTLWVVGGPLPTAASLEACGRRQPMVAVGNRLAAFLAVPASQAPGEVVVTALLQGAGVPERATTTIRVQPRHFPASRIRASPSQLEARSEEKLREDQEKVRRAKSSSAPRPLWEGEFILPLDAPISTPYGFIRYINDREVGRHAGVDLVAPAGTPVVATNAGRVVFADRLHAAGLTVIVDHGLSLFSSYCHLSRIAVGAGDTVRKGQVVGWVGNTGFSTGPHLHWSVTVGLNSVDPASLTGPRPWLGSLPR